MIKTAIDHGTSVAAEVARRVADAPAEPASEGAVLDLCVVGAGPAGLAASLEARRHGLSFVTIDQEERPGGTVARYPRRKLVTTQPIELPLYGKFRQTSFTKEELVDLWQGAADEQELPIAGGLTFLGAEQEGEGFRVRTSGGDYRARHVCLALGRRGAPRKLGIPGEDAAKVAYSLLDARSYAGRRVMVIGGGDSAVEAALALAEQEGTEVTLSYRRTAFVRIKAVNERRLYESVQANQIRLELGTNATAIHPDRVDLVREDGSAVSVPNDEVFAMIGGIAPKEVLEASGVSFDPKLRAPVAKVTESGTGLVKALSWALALTLLALGFALYHRGYYGLERSMRPAHPSHDVLRPGRGLGLAMGIGSIALVAINLLYLVRRHPGFAARFAGWPIGSLKGWMTSHVGTGVLAFLLAMLHAAMAPRSTVGGHAMWALLALLVTGAIGRYMYAWVPRAANGRELELDEVKQSLAAMSADWDGEHGVFGAEARARVHGLVMGRQWPTTMAGRAKGMILGNRELNHALAELRASGQAQGLATDQIDGVLALTRRAFSAATGAAHLEDIRAVLGSWRYAHRWVAALMVALALLHIGHALFYGQILGGADDLDLTHVQPGGGLR